MPTETKRTPLQLYPPWLSKIYELSLRTSIDEPKEIVQVQISVPIVVV